MEFDTAARRLLIVLADAHHVGVVNGLCCILRGALVAVSVPSF
jgi:hypothetical protein